jgi:hypothetical protein
VVAANRLLLGYAPRLPVGFGGGSFGGIYKL